MRKHRKLTNANSCCLDAKWIDSPDTLEMTDRQFRDAIRLAVALWSSTRKPNQWRPRVFKRVTALWGHLCAYCGSSDGPFEVEHIIPLSRGGTNALDNLTVSCKPCNRKKYTLTAAEFGFPHVHARAKELMGDHKGTSATD